VEGLLAIVAIYSDLAVGVYSSRRTARVVGVDANSIGWKKHDLKIQIPSTGDEDTVSG